MAYAPQNRLKLVKNEQNWLKTPQNAPLDPLNQPGCLSTHWARLFGTIRCLCNKQSLSLSHTHTYNVAHEYNAKLYTYRILAVIGTVLTVFFQINTPA